MKKLNQPSFAKAKLCHIFEANKDSNVIHRDWKLSLNHYVKLIKKIMHGNVIFNCRSYRKGNVNCMTLTLDGSDAKCIINFIESGKIDIPKYSKCFIKNMDTQCWHSTWHLIDSVDMYYVACFIADFLNADLNLNNTGNQLDFLMIQDVQERRIKELY